MCECVGVWVCVCVCSRRMKTKQKRQHSQPPKPSFVSRATCRSPAPFSCFCSVPPSRNLVPKTGSEQNPKKRERLWGKKRFGVASRASEMESHPKTRANHNFRPHIPTKTSAHWPLTKHLSISDDRRHQEQQKEEVLRVGLG